MERPVPVGLDQEMPNPGLPRANKAISKENQKVGRTPALALVLVLHCNTAQTAALSALILLGTLQPHYHWLAAGS